MKGDVSKLPRWAQLHIENLERRVDSLNRELNRLLTHGEGESENDTFIETYASVNDEGRLPLGYEPRIIFQVGPHKRDTIECRTQDGAVRVMAGGSLLVHPHVTNVVYLELDNR